MINFSNFITEVNKSTIYQFKDPSISNKFTCSLEIELETKDKKGGDNDYSEKEVTDIINIIKKSLFKELNRIENFKLTPKIKEFIENIFYELENDYDDYDYIVDDILIESKYKGIEKKIIGIIKPSILNYFFVDDFTYLKKKLKKSLPKFWSKWKNDIKLEFDNTLDRGIEISNSSYFKDINTMIEFIEDFYSDFDKQKYWKFNSNTGIHINIGPSEKLEFNPIKGLLFLNDKGDSPFVFQNMEWREKSKFCGSLLSELSDKSKVISKSSEFLRSNQIGKCEDLLNTTLIQILRKEGYKNYGANLLPIDSNNYVEFRYAGGKIEKQTLIEKFLYFTYIIDLMTNSNLNSQEYHKKLYKFLN